VATGTNDWPSGEKFAINPIKYFSHMVRFVKMFNLPINGVIQEKIIATHGSKNISLDSSVTMLWLPLVN
jgi:hypothetical protein